MEYTARSYSKFWDTITFDKEEVAEFFTSVHSRFTLNRDVYEHLDSRKTHLRQDVYEWCLDNLGHEFMMDHVLDRTFFSLEDLPNLTLAKNKVKMAKKLGPAKWCIIQGKGIAFSDSKDAMLFKLSWGVRGAQ